MDAIERIKQASALLLAEFQNEYGKDAKIEDGEEIIGLFNDGVLRLGMDDSTVQVNLWKGSPYKINAYLIEPDEESVTGNE